MPKVTWLVNDWRPGLEPRPGLLTCLNPPGDPAVPACPATPWGLASTEHVVRDADPGGGLTDQPLHDGQVHHLQDAGLHLAGAGCPGLLQVAPACHPPLVSSPEQPLEKREGSSENRTSRSSWPQHHL